MQYKVKPSCPHPFLIDQIMDCIERGKYLKTFWCDNCKRSMQTEFDNSIDGYQCVPIQCLCGNIVKVEKF